jgi:hypothetical protein
LTCNCILAKSNQVEHIPLLRGAAYATDKAGHLDQSSTI